MDMTYEEYIEFVNHLLQGFIHDDTIRAANQRMLSQSSERNLK